jgi:molybdenum cofactor guanylyltransferase
MPTYSAVILAGGESSRFNYKDKTFLTLNDQTFIEHQVEIVYDLCEQIIISLKNQQQQMRVQRLLETKRRDIKKITYTTDVAEYKDSGPLIGVLSSVRSVISDYIVVISIDMPRLTTHLLNILMQEIVKEKASVACYKDMQNFLTTSFFVVNNKLFTKIFESLVKISPYRISNLFRLADKVMILSIDQTHKLINVNTQKDLNETKQAKILSKKSKLLTKEIVNPKDSLLKIDYKKEKLEKVRRIAIEEYNIWRKYHLRNHIESNLKERFDSTFDSKSFLKLKA